MKDGFKDFLKRHKVILDVVLFVVIIMSFHYTYRHFAPVFSKWQSYQMISGWLVDRVFFESKWFIQTFLYDVTVDGRTMWFPNEGYITISGGCSGLKLFYQYAVLLLLFPGPWKHKLWFIPLGVLIMHATNLFRIVSLSVILMNWPQYWDFSHDWILRPFFYVVIFGLWMIWNDKIRRN